MKKDYTGKPLPPMSTGLPGLDRVLHGLMAGDNVVLEVDSIDDYLPFIKPFLARGRAQGIKLIYFRFARHARLVPEDAGVETVQLDPGVGFEKFLGKILDVVEAAGTGAYYIFDCLSDLAVDWYSDRMLGNFFMIACPFLYQLDTIAYFALLKNHHSFHATDCINNTAQVIIEIYRHRDKFFLHPLKVHSRSSPTLYMLHQWEGEDFLPVTSSALTAEVLAGTSKPWLDFTLHRQGVWVRTFHEAMEILADIQTGLQPVSHGTAIFERLVTMAITREERFIHLAQQYFDLADLVDIMKRMIGTGLIGGKSLGMLLARAILKKNDVRWANRLEVHDSFYIGSDVFYTYLVQNGCWWLRRKQNQCDFLIPQADEARDKLLHGNFPDYIKTQFMEMLDYFGQSPIIVRSSSLLEDNYGNAFSGKYKSIYCANQGTPRQRLDAFLDAIREIYASTMSPEAISYRQVHNLLDRDEQMAILVQRVSGTMYERFFFPLAAGVGFSFNPYVWNSEIDPEAGMLRLVAGLGTRAVDRHDDDYTRIISLNAPERRPEGNEEKIRQYTQRQLDILDLDRNELLARPFDEAGRGIPESQLDVIASRDEEVTQYSTAQSGGGAFPWMLTFDRLLNRTAFIEDMRTMLKTLHKAYQYPVDVEFTVNFLEGGDYRINLVQCRPFQVRIRRGGSRIYLPDTIAPKNLILQSNGPVIGQSVSTLIDRIVYVDPEGYGKLAMAERYSIARLIGRITHLDDGGAKSILLIGPGRWGTSMPALGIPVSFAEINTVSVLCEIVQMREGLVPDVSLGTHFFNDLVEIDMLYFALFPERKEHSLNCEFFDTAENRLAELVPDAEAWSKVVRVIDSEEWDELGTIYLNVDAMKQKVLCYREAPKIGPIISSNSFLR
jgi:hypothetical protein